jgi:hypothetical protein
MQVYGQTGSVNIFLPPSPLAPMTLKISNITQGYPMVVTVSNLTPLTPYITGQVVYLSVPFDYGMYQANALTPQIIAINGSQFSLNVDSTQFDPFVIPPSSGEAPASLAPGGSRNTYNFTSLPFHSIDGQVGN